ncbi:MAG TPA: hypothetical protein VFK78_03565 [Gemmatimonadales bacterium]|nr:hypothetical protein [Gemmatimonadales bacterium]
MTRKIAAVLLLVGLCLPYSCSVRPITGVWDDWASILGIAVPMLCGIAYAAHVLLPPLARFHQRNGASLHGLFRAVCLILSGFYLAELVRGGNARTEKIGVVVTLAVCYALLLWQQGRGSKAQRLPLLLLAIFGLPEVFYFATGLSGGLEYGGWIVTLGWVVAVAEEIRGLARAAPVTHGG